MLLTLQKYLESCPLNLGQYPKDSTEDQIPDNSQIRLPRLHKLCKWVRQVTPKKLQFDAHPSAAINGRNHRKQPTHDFKSLKEKGDGIELNVVLTLTQKIVIPHSCSVTQEICIPAHLQTVLTITSFYT